ncbi:cupin domain-containing protein [Plantactinospora siamensis]|uniref:Cupin domain-containing protein n=1 Tax=Plantactinospora siamensis TaxID=555372 RepID=A0ABV6P1H8_9ACTN
MSSTDDFTGPVIDNPVSGERIRIRVSAAQSGGKLLAWELRLAPGGRVPSGHVHPGQEERFSVIRGRLRFRLGWRRRVVGPGQSVTVPPGVPHHFANAGPTEAVVLVETRPAMQMAELLRVAAELARDQHGRPRWLPRPVDLLLFMDEFAAEVRAPFLPVRLVRVVVRGAARLAAGTGADARYRRLRAR